MGRHKKNKKVLDGQNQKNKKQIEQGTPNKTFKITNSKNKSLSNKKSLVNILQECKGSKSLREKMQEQLKASRFRYINEQMYTSKGKDAKKLFQEDPQLFAAYHDGYRQQVERWPLNPLDIIMKSIKKMPLLKELTIADLGCGEARLGRTFRSKVLAVHSFDLIATCEEVVVCDIAHCPLPSASIDVAVYCLSLMGTNLCDYLVEANRILKLGAVLKIAEVESRFQNVDVFIKELKKYGFTITWKDFTCNMFYFLDFRKDQNIRNKNILPNIKLQPCLYKKR